MNEIKTLVLRAIYDCERIGIRPTCAYLGDDEYLSLRSSLESALMVRTESDGPDQFMGLLIHRVREKSHFRVV